MNERNIGMERLAYISKHTSIKEIYHWILRIHSKAFVSAKIKNHTELESELSKLDEAFRIYFPTDDVKKQSLFIIKINGVLELKLSSPRSLFLGHS